MVSSKSKCNILFDLPTPYMNTGIMIIMIMVCNLVSTDDVSRTLAGDGEYVDGCQLNWKTSNQYVQYSETFKLKQK